MRRTRLVIDKASYDLPSDLLGRYIKRLIVRDVRVYPTLPNDEYILHSNLVQVQSSTETTNTSNFVCFCNQPYLVSKDFYIVQNIRTLKFWFTTLSGKTVDDAELKFIIDLEF